MDIYIVFASVYDVKTGFERERSTRHAIGPDAHSKQGAGVGDGAMGSGLLLSMH